LDFFYDSTAGSIALTLNSTAKYKYRKQVGVCMVSMIGLKNTTFLFYGKLAI